MKRINYFLLLVFILVLGCSDENATGIQNLKDGEFVIKLYNSNGNLLLSKKGDAENLGAAGSNWEIRLIDRAFGQQNSDPLKTFASLTIFGDVSISDSQELQFNTDNAAYFFERWYSLEDDWGYKSTGGTLRITSTEQSIIKGSFEIELEVDAEFAQQNPLWGERIVAKGYFSSICPGGEYGGCL